MIILKYEKITDTAKERNIQYEIYNPITYEKLNMDICDNIDIVIPIKLDEEIQDLYKSLNKEGYDLFYEMINSIAVYVLLSLRKMARM